MVALRSHPTCRAFTARRCDDDRIQAFRATAPAGVPTLPVAAQEGGARDVILMVSDGAGVDGRPAVDHDQGLAGEPSHQTAQSDGTEPVLHGMAHDSPNLVGETGAVPENASDRAEAAGAVERGHDPRTRWTRFEDAVRHDLPPVGEEYTSCTDSAAAGTTLKTANRRIILDWSGRSPSARSRTSRWIRAARPSPRRWSHTPRRPR